MCKAKGTEVICIYCHAKDNFGTRLPNIRYVNHLVSEHKILHDIDNVVQRTIKLHRRGIDVSDDDNDDDNDGFKDLAEKEREVVQKSDGEKEEIKDENKKEERRSRRLNSSQKEEVGEDKPEEVVAKKSVVRKRSHSLMLTFKSQTLPWFAGCEYQCQFEGCGQMFYYNQDLRSHVRKEHCSADKYLDCYKQFETKAVFINCLECKQEVKRHYASVLNHLEKDHAGMSLEQYKKKHHAKDYKVTYQEVEREKKKKAKVEEPTSKQGVQEGNYDAKFRKWVSQCRMICKICQETYDNYVWYGKHLKTDHGMTIKEYNDKHGTIYEAKEVHKCVLCKQTVLQEQSHLFNHVWRQHNMSVKTYYRNHYITSFNVKTNNDDNVVNNGTSQLMENGFIDRLDQCEYTCKLCSFKTKNRSDFTQNHLVAKHGFGPAQYIQTYGNMETAVKYHKCLKCKQTIKQDATITESHVLKAHKMSLEQYHNKYKGVIRDMHESDQHVRWADKCTYKCQMCNHSTKNRKKFNRHVSKIHNLRFKEYCTKFESNPESEVVYHNCKVCSKKIKHDSAMIGIHVSSMHRISMQYYYQKYINEKQEEVDQTSIKGDGDANVTEQTSTVPNLKHTDWANQCTYTCKMCNYVTKIRMSFVRFHLPTHSLRTKEYCAKFGTDDIASELVYHKCKACGMKVQHDNNILSWHFRFKHNLTVLEYYKKYINPEATINKESDDQPEGKLDEGGETTTENHANDHKSDQEGNVRTVPHQKGSVIMPFQNGSVLKPEKLKKRKKDAYQQWRNSCEYQCKICPHFAQTRSSFKGHLKTRHKLSTKAYVEQFGVLESKSVYHQCNLCKKRVLQDSQLLDVHCRLIHKHTMCSYYQKYISNKPDSAEESRPPKKKTNVVKEAEEEGQFDQLEIDFEGWKNKCKYACRKCEYVTQSRLQFFKHFKQSHKLNVQSYIRLYGSLMTNTQRHICKVCSKRVSHDEILMKVHMKRQHQMTVKDYFSKFIGNESSKGPVDNSDVQSVFCNNTPRAAIELQPPQSLAEWMNQCTYQCRKCNAKLESDEAFSNHIAYHGIDSMEDYVVTHGHPLKITSLFHCAICSSLVKHDPDIITQHLTDQHEMSPEEYFKQYVNPEGKLHQNTGAPVLIVGSAKSVMTEISSSAENIMNVLSGCTESIATEIAEQSAVTKNAGSSVATHVAANSAEMESSAESVSTEMANSAETNQLHNNVIRSETSFDPELNKRQTHGMAIKQEINDENMEIQDELDNLIN